MGAALILARRFAEQALMARLPRASAERRAQLRQRIARVRAGTFDHAPEVQAALLAVTFFGQPQDVEQTVTDSSAVEAETVCAGGPETGAGERNGGSGGGRAQRKPSVCL